MTKKTIKLLRDSATVLHENTYYTYAKELRDLADYHERLNKARKKFNAGIARFPNGAPIH